MNETRIPALGRRWVGQSVLVLAVFLVGGCQPSAQPQGESATSEPQMKAVQLAPMRVAYYCYKGKEPEGPAIEAVIGWAARNGVLRKDSRARFFGFNNPNPSKGNPVYGYEFWMLVGDDATGDDKVKIKDVPGGLYATTGPQPTIAKMWQSFESLSKTWMEHNGYEYDGERQWLEEAIPNAARYPEFPSLCGKDRWRGYAVLVPIRKRK